MGPPEVERRAVRSYIHELRRINGNRNKLPPSVPQPSLVEPGTICEYRIRLWETSNVFAAGHRIRLEVSSSNFPRFDRNLNTGEDPGLGTRMAVARQTVLHDGPHPSHLVLPVIPR